jgi:hypothetical protein
MAMAAAQKVTEDCFLELLDSAKNNGGIDSDQENSLLEAWQHAQRPADVVPVKREDASSGQEQPPQDASRAQYMRYYRGISNVKRCGPELYKKAKEEGVSLYDLWIEAKESWSEVLVLSASYEKVSSRQFMRENYMTKAQIADHYKDPLVADELVKEKTRKGPPWAVRHPELPDNDDAVLYLVWHSAGQGKTQETGSTKTVQASTALDMADPNTAAVVNALPSPATDNAEFMPGGKDQKGTGFTAAKAKAKPKPKPTPKKIDDPYDKNRSELTKLGNKVKSAQRTLAGILIELKEGSYIEDSKAVFMASANGLKIQLEEPLPIYSFCSCPCECSHVII